MCIRDRGAAVTFPYETEHSLEEVRALADVVHDNRNMAASISSGSYETVSYTHLDVYKRQLAT